MTTITLSWTDYAAGLDLVRVTDGDIETASLVDAVAISLLSWRRARDSDPVPEGAERHGWWADPEFGSRLWLVARSKTLPTTPRDAQDYAQEALAWMVAEGIASRVTVTAERMRSGLSGGSVTAGFTGEGKGSGTTSGATRGGSEILALSIEIERPTAPALLIRFADLWEAL